MRLTTTTSSSARGRFIHLKHISSKECNDTYLSWLNDPQVNQFLETRFSQQTLHTIREFVATINDSPDSLLLGIFRNDNRLHIGNIKVGPVHSHYARADISYFIGDRTAWGQGFGGEAVQLMTDIAFKQLSVRKLRALARETNLASQRVLEKAGYHLEATFDDEERRDPSADWEDVKCFVKFSHLK